MLVCPVCKNDIIKIDNTYKCQANSGKIHSFDIHKSGYVNLLLSNKMNSKLPGDNKLMVEARRNFLNNGYYSELLNNIKNVIDNINPKTILDAGCGEGYYTKEFSSCNREVIGVDISKTAIQFATKVSQNITFIVASLFSLPIKDNSVDLLINVFAPYVSDEFHRVIKEDGYMILVIPGRDHLLELKSVIYENPYENNVKDYHLDGFRFIESKKVYNKINIDNSYDIDNLFKMTPYYYRTKKEDYDKILNKNNLNTTINFEILIYRRAN